MILRFALLIGSWAPLARAELPADPVREDVRGTATSIASVHDALRALDERPGGSGERRLWAEDQVIDGRRLRSRGA